MEREINSKVGLDEMADAKSADKKNIASAKLLEKEAALIKSSRIKLNKIAKDLNATIPGDPNKISHQDYAKELSTILIDSNVALKIQAYVLKNREQPDIDTIKEFFKDEAMITSMFGNKKEPDGFDDAWTAYKNRYGLKDPPPPPPPLPPDFSNKEEYMNFLNRLKNKPKYQDVDRKTIDDIITIAEEVYDEAKPNIRNTYTKSDIIVNFDSLLLMARNEQDKFDKLVRGAVTRRVNRAPRGGRRIRRKTCRRTSRP